MIVSEALESLSLRTTDITDPSVTSTDTEVRRMFDALNATGFDMMRRAEWRDLLKVINVVSPVESIPLPDDFHRLQENNAVVVRLTASSVRIAKMVNSPILWEHIDSVPGLGLIYPYARIQGDTLHLHPTVETSQSTGQSVTVHYVSKNWVGGGDRIANNGDRLNLPGDVLVKGAVYRWNRLKGFDYEDYLSEYEAALQAEITVNRGLP